LGSASKRLPELHHAPNLLVSGTMMCGVADQIVKQRVRGHLGVASPARPILRRSQQCASIPGAPYVGIDVPRFHKSDGAGVTAIGIGPGAGLDESGSRAVITLHH